MSVRSRVGWVPLLSAAKHRKCGAWRRLSFEKLAVGVSLPPIFCPKSAELIENTGDDEKHLCKSAQEYENKEVSGWSSETGRAGRAPAGWAAIFTKHDSTNLSNCQ